MVAIGWLQVTHTLVSDNSWTPGYTRWKRAEEDLENILCPCKEAPNPLDPADYAERVRRSTFPGETFRVLKEKELREHGEYLTNRLVLEAWARIREERLRI